MKHNKHVYDEDYVFSIKLMVPLLSMLVCTICLCATTWAWYTASVSTGVNSIVAGANVSETVTYDENCPGCTLSSTDGVYVLKPEESGEPKTYTVIFTPGGAENGYLALIDIENHGESYSTNTLSLLDLFINRVYAEESEIQAQSSNEIKGYVCISNNNQNSNRITITVASTKELKIQYIWKVDDANGNIVWDDNYRVYSVKNFGETNDIKVTETQSTEQATVTFNFINAETGEALPYSALGIETYGLSENEELPQTATIVLEADLEKYEIFAPDGYLLKLDESRGETEDQESRIYTLEPGKDVVINVSCVVRPESSPNQNTGDLESSGEHNANEGINDNPSENQDPISQTNNEPISDNDSNQENGVSSQDPTESATETDTGEFDVPPVEENNGETSEDGSSNLSTSNSDNQATPEQQTGTSDTVESLLVTDTTPVEETSDDTQPTDISSSIDTSSETETNVSE